MQKNQAMLKEAEDALAGKDAEMQQLQVHMPWGDSVCEGSRSGCRRLFKKLRTLWVKGERKSILMHIHCADALRDLHCRDADLTELQSLLEGKEREMKQQADEAEQMLQVPS
jgi:hypothetical protein